MFLVFLDKCCISSGDLLSCDGCHIREESTEKSFFGRSGGNVYKSSFFLILNRLWQQIPSWSLMAMPRPPGMTTLLVLANSSESTSTDRFPSPNHTSWSRFIFFRVNSLGVTSSLTSLRSQGSPNNKKLSAAITSSIKCFSRQFLNLR